MLTVHTHPTALKDMAVELYRRGKHDKAALMARKALENRGTLEIVEVIQWSVLLGMCERAVGRDEEALRIHLELSPLVESLREDCPEDNLLRGKFHNGLAITYKKLGQYDKAFQEYTAASYYHELAGAIKEHAEIESNIANLLIQVGQPGDAHEHLDKAMRGCDDSVTIGQIEDVKAKAHFAERNTRLALRVAATSVLRLLSAGNEQALDDSVATLAQIATYWPLMREAERIKKALRDAGGHVESAATALGYKNRQTLENKINRQFPFLEVFRKPKRKRRKNPKA